MLSLRGLLTSLACIGFVTGVAAAPPSGKAGTCSELRLFKEWRDLSKENQQGYIQAVLCLMKLPPQDKSRPDPKSRFEEFQATHIYLTDRVHSVGHFLPWHRHLGTLYANALRDECGYKGPIAFWDWSRDADNRAVPLKNSPIFDPVSGFGGDGVPGTYTLPPDPVGDSALFPWTFRGCVGDGPFKDIKVHLGPGKLLTEHCIVRGIDESWRRTALTPNVQRVLESKTYEDFRLIIDEFMNPIHGGGHGIVGGEMLNIYSAAADPIFYLHHANLDRIWWKWQEADPAKRLYQISGPTTQRGTDQITLDFVLDFPALGPNITVRDTMDSRSAPECFVYDY